ncbi:MAG: hypothetical protein R6V16_11670 [Bacteroidales bacterium]
MMISRKKIVITGGFFLMIVILIALLQVFKPAKNLHKVKPDHTVTSSQLFVDFSENESQANAKYVGKIILVKGEINEIIHANDEMVILLKTEDLFSGISCRLADSEFSKAELLNKNQRIAVKGQCAGKLMDVVLNNGVIINH